MNFIFKTTSVLIFVFFFSVNAIAQMEHFHPKGKMPSKYTVEKQKKLRETMPFSDQKDFEEQKKGFVAAPDFKQISPSARTWRRAIWV